MIWYLLLGGCVAFAICVENILFPDDGEQYTGGAWLAVTAIVWLLWPVVIASMCMRLATRETVD